MIPSRHRKAAPIGARRKRTLLSFQRPRHLEPAVKKPPTHGGPSELGNLLVSGSLEGLLLVVSGTFLQPPHARQPEHDSNGQAAVKRTNRRFPACTRAPSSDVRGRS